MIERPKVTRKKPQHLCADNAYPGEPAWLRSEIVPDGRVFQDDARAALVGEVRPRPREQYDETVAKPDQKEDVNEQPRHPCRHAAELEAPELGHPGAHSDGGQRSLVDVVERLRWLSCDTADDIRGDVPSLLDRGRGHPWNPLSVLLESGEIATDE